MQSTRTQTLFRYLPGAVFVHEDGVIARSYRVDGTQAQSKVNRAVFLEELRRELDQWPSDRIAGIPRPGTVPDTEFTFIEPERVDWEVWPLLFTCSNLACQRAKRFFRHDQAYAAADPDKGLVCKVCRSRLKQIRYFTAHECGRVDELFTPECKHCGQRDHVYLEDTGSFETAAWRCRACSNAYIQGTRFKPCNCSDYGKDGRPGFMRAYPVRDHRTFYPQMLSQINLESRTYEDLQKHPDKGVVAVASFIGDERNIKWALDELGGGAGAGERMSASAWAEREKILRQSGLAEAELNAIRDRLAPVDEGIGGLRSLAGPVLELGEGRRMLERAMLFDPNVVPDRRSLADARAEEAALGRTLAVEAIQSAEDEANSLGIEEISVTLEFPILLGAYGFTRKRRDPGAAHLHGFAKQNQYDGKTPIFVAVSKTEAILVSLAARDVMGWLASVGLVGSQAFDSERDARLALLETYAEEGAAADRARTLVHSFAHAMLRALDDGQTGFGESSLAEWVVPEALTFGIYVASYQSYTLGALWTLLHTRTRAWLERTRSSVWTCQNDPLCHHREPKACERCMYLTFGCREFNGSLSRSDLMSFWRHTGATERSTAVA